MKPARMSQATPEATVRVEFRVQFSGGPKGQRRASETAVASGEQDSPTTSVSSPAPSSVKGASLHRIPKISRLLVLGHHFEMLIREGVVKNYAEIGRQTGLSRARVTQIANLTLLAPEIQEVMLLLPSESNEETLTTERHLRRIIFPIVWCTQCQQWNAVLVPPTSSVRVMCQTSSTPSVYQPKSRH